MIWPSLARFANADFVSAEGEALVEAGGFLASKLGHGPAFVGSFDLVEAAFTGVFDGEEFDVVSPTEGERIVEFSSRLLLNLDGAQFASRLLAFLRHRQLVSSLLTNAMLIP